MARSMPARATVTHLACSQSYRATCRSRTARQTSWRPCGPVRQQSPSQWGCAMNVIHPSQAAVRMDPCSTASKKQATLVGRAIGFPRMVSRVVWSATCLKTVGTYCAGVLPSSHPDCTHLRASRPPQAVLTKMSGYRMFACSGLRVFDSQGRGRMTRRRGGMNSDAVTVERA